MEITTRDHDAASQDEVLNFLLESPRPKSYTYLILVAIPGNPFCIHLPSIQNAQMIVLLEAHVMVHTVMSLCYGIASHPRGGNEACEDSALNHMSPNSGEVLDQVDWSC